MAEEQQVYVSAAKTVGKARDSQGCLYCVHRQHFPSSEACEEAYQRLQTQKQLQHPSICQVYAVHRDSNSLHTDMEWCGQALHTLQCAWTQEDCWQLLCSVSGALAYAQLQGVAHGAVHPGVLYYTESELYKISNFKPSALSPKSLCCVPKPFFLCPAKRRAYSSLLLGESLPPTSPNPYKSDVFSFALVLIHLLQPSAPLTLSSLQSLLASLPLHEAFLGLLQRMLEPEEADRLDWTQVEREVLTLQGAGPKEELKEEVREATGQKRRRKVVKKAPTDLVPVGADRLCPGCGHTFLYNASEAWRLDLIGSVSCGPAAQYCSNACFSQTFAPPQPAQNAFLLEEDEEDETDTLPPVLGMVFSLLNGSRTGRPTTLPASLQILEPYQQFYHCFVHKFYSQRHEYTTPTVLTRCPQCPGGELTTEVLQPLDVEVVHNSLYSSFVFVSEEMARSIAYIPMSLVFRAALEQAQCHICHAQLQSHNWMCLFHGDRLDLACLSCTLTATQQTQCPTCNLPMKKLQDPPIRRQDVKRLKGHILVRSEQWCKLCLIAPTDWTLPCGHQFCYSCLALQPDLPDSLGCLYCGRVLDKAEHTDLMQALGRQ